MPFRVAVDNKVNSNNLQKAESVEKELLNNSNFKTTLFRVKENSSYSGEKPYIIEENIGNLFV